MGIKSTEHTEHTDTPRAAYPIILTHICRGGESTGRYTYKPDCILAALAFDAEDEIAAFEEYNKCPDCCPVIGCGECGPCSEHDAIIDAYREGIEAPMA